VIEVADQAPTVIVTQAVSRLRSSPLGVSYPITATSNQKLATLPVFSVGIPVSGTWAGSAWIGGEKIKTRNIIINDSDLKGTGNWFWDSATPTNKAGIPANIQGTETVGGFLERVLTIAAWPNREAAIGTLVTDTSKLVCENLSKGGGGPYGGTMFIYQFGLANALDHYSIINTDTWYNCDQPNAVSNTTGTAQVILSESA
jgi:hypothetical protein